MPIIIQLIVVALLLNSQGVQAALLADIKDPGAKGLAIAQKSYETDSGFVDFFAELTIIQVDKSGDEHMRHIRLWAIEGEEGNEQSRSVFTYPPDIKGMARLSHGHNKTPDDHWIYLPEEKRTKRISPSNQLSYFMGTQFTFEDLRLYRAEQVDKYSYNYLGNEKIDGLDCYKIERFPTGKKFTNYSRHIMWIDRQEFRVIKVEFYDLAKQLLKTLSRSKFKLYKGKFWCMHEMEMTNKQTGEKTVVVWQNYRFDTGLKKSDFTPASLRRQR